MSRLNNDMYACGQAGLPETVFCSNQTWHLEQTFKHDFFACTGLYMCPDTNQRCVLKISRLQSFLGIPLAWLGRYLCGREMKILERLSDLDQVPQKIAAFGHNGLIYKFIEGKSLDERPVLANNFFFMLSKLLERVHAANICYVDMNKRGNIIVGKDGRPHLIDFQISLYLPGSFLAPLRNYLQKEDRYHLLKHKRRLRPDLLSEDEWQDARQKSLPIRLHRRLIANPFRAVRRAILRFLYKKQILSPRSHMLSTPENDHRRFLR